MKVLIVEDYEPEAFLLASMISAMVGRLDIAHTLRDAWQFMKGQLRYDVVFFDLTLSDANPVQSLEAVQEMNKLARIVIVTGNDDPKMERRALEAGAHSYLQKHDPHYADRVIAQLLISEA